MEVVQKKDNADEIPQQDVEEGIDPAAEVLQDPRLVPPIDHLTVAHRQETGMSEVTNFDFQLYPESGMMYPSHADLPATIDEDAPLMMMKEQAPKIKQEDDSKPETSQVVMKAMEDTMAKEAAMKNSTKQDQKLPIKQPDTPTSLGAEGQKVTIKSKSNDGAKEDQKILFKSDNGHKKKELPVYLEKDATKLKIKEGKEEFPAEGSPEVNAAAGNTSPQSNEFMAAVAGDVQGIPTNSGPNVVVIAHPGAFAMAGPGRAPDANSDLFTMDELAENNDSGDSSLFPEQASPDPATSNLITANPVDEEEAAGPSLVAKEYVATQKEDNHTLIGKVLLFGLLLLLAIVVTVTVLIKKNAEDDTDKSSITETNKANDASSATIAIINMTREEEILNLLPELTLQDIQLSDQTAQAKAFQWLLDDPSFETYSDTRVLQRFALATLFFSTLGEYWVHDEFWLDHTVHECEWFSRNESNTYPIEVTNGEPPCVNLNTSSEGDELQYTRLWLHENKLAGSIPDEIYLLTSLSSLSLHGNPEFGGTLSTLIGRLTNLDTLYMASLQRLTGTIPTEVGMLSRLNDLQMFYTGLRSRKEGAPIVVPTTVASCRLQNKYDDCYIVLFPL